MIAEFLSASLLIGLLVSPADSFSSGAPVNACADLNQQHSGQSPCEDCPFEIVPVSNVANGYQCGIIHRFRLQTTNSAMTFRGFAVQARQSTPLFDTNAPFEGAFANDGGLWRIWPCNANSATHNTAVEKTAVEFTWLAPSFGSTSDVTLWFSITREFAITHSQLFGLALSPDPAFCGPTPTPPPESAVISIEQSTYTALEGEILEVCVLVVEAPLGLSAPVAVNLHIELPLLSLWVSILVTPASPRECGSFAFPNDDVDNGDLNLVIMADLPQNDNPNIILGEDSAALLLIDDDVSDTAVELALLDQGYNVTEGDESLQVCIGVVSGTLAETVIIGVHLETFFGSAWISITLEIGLTAGDSRCGLLTTGFLDNDEFDGNRILEVEARISQASSDITITRATAPVMVIDNEVDISFENGAYTVSEGSAVDVCLIVLRGRTVSAFGISIHVESSILSVWLDIRFEVGLIPGSRRCASLAVPDDEIHNFDTTVTINATFPDPVPGAIISRDTASLFISDNEAAILVGIEQSSYTIIEGENLTVCVSVFDGEVAEDIVISIHHESFFGSAWVSLILETGLTAGAQRCGLLQLGFLEDDLFNGDSDRFITINARLEDDIPWVTLTQPSSIVFVRDNEVDLAIEREVYTGLEGEEVEVCVVVARGRIVLAGVRVYLHVESIFGSAWIEVRFEVGLAMGDRACGMLPIPDDMIHIVNNTGAITATLIDPIPGVIFSRSSAELRIADDEEPVEVGIADDYTITEGENAQVCAAVFRGVLALDISVSIHLITPFGSAWISVTLEAGLTVGDLRCGILPAGFLDDEMVTGDRMFEITATMAQNIPWVFLTRNRAQLTVIDNDEAPVASVVLAQNAFSVEEGGTLDVCVSAMNLGDEDVTVIVGLHIEEFDFWCNLTFTLDAGSDAQRQYKDIPIPDDDFVNPGRSVYLLLMSSDPRVLIPDNASHALVEIEDNDGPVAYVELAQTQFSVEEGGALDVCVSAVNHGDDDVTIVVELHIEEFDFWCNLTFMLEGNTGQRQYKDIPIPDDDLVNPGRSVYLVLTSSDPRVLVPDNASHALVEIEDNDRPPLDVYVRIEPGRYSAVEGRLIEICVSAMNHRDEDVTIIVEVHAPEINFWCNITFMLEGNGEQRQYKDVPIPDDDFLNEDSQREIELTIASSDPGVLIEDGFDSATLIIIDNEIVQVGFEEAEYTVIEGEGSVHICIQLIQGSRCQRPVVVRVHTRECDPGAEEGADYVPLWEIVSVNINAEQGDVFCFYVNLIDDDDQEEPEVFKVDIEVFDINAFVPFDSRVAVVTILDDDEPECPPLSILNGTVAFSDELSPGSNASYSCDLFFTLNGDANRICQENETWTGSDPVCERDPFELICSTSSISPQGPINVMCFAPGYNVESLSCDYDNGSLVEECDFPIIFSRFDPGDHELVITATSVEGLEATFEISFTVPVPLDLQCTQTDLSSSSFSFVCIANNDLFQPLFCSIVDDATGMEAFSFPCALDQQNTVGLPDLMAGVDYVLTVSAIDVFEGQDEETLEFTLIGFDCEELLDPANGQVSFPDVTPGSVANYSCDSNFMLNGTAMRTCQANGDWSGEEPTCDLIDLTVQFSGDTPNVNQSVVYVQFTSNVPLDSAECSITGQSPIDCTSGEATFTGVGGVRPRTITISAISEGLSCLISRVVRSESTGQCSNHLINDGVSVTDDGVEFELQVIGPSSDTRVTDSECTLDGGATMPCPDPFVFSLDAGDHSVLIRPVDPTGICSRRQGLIVPFTV